MSTVTLSIGAAACLFLGVMLHAAVTDLRRRQIVNTAIVALLVGYFPLAYLAGLPLEVMATSLAAAVLVFFIGFGCFCAGWMGGGDVKLAAVTTLWIGAKLVVPYLLLASVFGALITLGMIALAQWQARIDGKDVPKLEGIPYGPGLVLAALALFGNSAWFAQG